MGEDLVGFAVAVERDILLIGGIGPSVRYMVDVGATDRAVGVHPFNVDNEAPAAVGGVAGLIEVLLGAHGVGGVGVDPEGLHGAHWDNPLDGSRSAGPRGLPSGVGGPHAPGGGVAHTRVEARGLARGQGGQVGAIAGGGLLVAGRQPPGGAGGSHAVHLLAIDRSLLEVMPENNVVNV